jgi:hypothetical protein
MSFKYERTLLDRWKERRVSCIFRDYEEKKSKSEFSLEMYGNLCGRWEGCQGSSIALENGRIVRNCKELLLRLTESGPHSNAPLSGWANERAGNYF